MAALLEKSIEVTVSDAGDVKFEAKGFQGGECLKATAALEKNLGTVKKRTMKVEATEKMQVAESVKLKT